jgi:hypothetical protein
MIALWQFCCSKRSEPQHLTFVQCFGWDSIACYHSYYAWGIVPNSCLQANCRNLPRRCVLAMTINSLERRFKQTQDKKKTQQTNHSFCASHADTPSPSSIVQKQLAAFSHRQFAIINSIPSVRHGIKVVRILQRDCVCVFAIVRLFLASILASTGLLISSAVHRHHESPFLGPSLLGSLER